MRNGKEAEGIDKTRHRVICSPQIPHYVNCSKTGLTTVGSSGRYSCSTARPPRPLTHRMFCVPCHCFLFASPFCVQNVGGSNPTMSIHECVTRSWSYLSLYLSRNGNILGILCSWDVAFLQNCMPSTSMLIKALNGRAGARGTTCRVNALLRSRSNHVGFVVDRAALGQNF
jgi:hypothetical protein